MKKKRFIKIQKAKSKSVSKSSKQNNSNLYGFTINTEDIFGSYKEPEIKTEDIDYTDLTGQKLLSDGNK